MAPKRTGKPGWDMAPAMDRKVRPDAKLKNLPAAEQETLWLLMHPTDADTPPYTLEQAAGFILEEHGFEPSLSSVSEWRRWYQLKQRMDSAAERAEQARLELAKDPSITPEDLERVAQTVFTAETLEMGNVKGYVALAKLRLASRALDHDARRLAVLEAKAAQADAAKGVLEQKLTPEEQNRRLREILK